MNLRQSPFARGEEPANELLRLRDVVRWLGVSEDFIAAVERAGQITAFRKCTQAKAWYRKWQLCSFLREPGKMQIKEPRAEMLRRADVLSWLGVPSAEFESWVRCGVISATRNRRAKAYYRRSEIKQKVLGF